MRVTVSYISKTPYESVASLKEELYEDVISLNMLSDSTAAIIFMSDGGQEYLEFEWVTKIVTDSEGYN